MPHSILAFLFRTMNVDKKFIDKTIEVWQPYCPDTELKADDAMEMISNITGFFRLLETWESQNRERDHDDFLPED